MKCFVVAQYIIIKGHEYFFPLIFFSSFRFISNKMSTASIVDAQRNIARYGLSTLLVLGNFGNIFTIILLARGIKRQINSCSLYLLSASISNWVVINTALISNIIGVDHIDPQNTSNVVCKLRWAGTHALLMLSRSFSKLTSISYIYLNFFHS